MSLSPPKHILACVRLQDTCNPGRVRCKQTIIGWNHAGKVRDERHPSEGDPTLCKCGAVPLICRSCVVGHVSDSFATILAAQFIVMAKCVRCRKHTYQWSQFNSYRATAWCLFTMQRKEKYGVSRMKLLRAMLHREWILIQRNRYCAAHDILALQDCRYPHFVLWRTRCHACLQLTQSNDYARPGDRRHRLCVHTAEIV